MAKSATPAPQDILPPFEMKDMKRPKPDDESGPSAMPADEDGGYPWGLQINLDEEELAKLGIKQLPAIGAEFHITAVGHVTSTRDMASAGGSERSMSIQIMFLGMREETEQPGEKESAAEENAENRGKVPMRTPPRPKVRL